MIISSLSIKQSAQIYIQNTIKQTHFLFCTHLYRTEQRPTVPDVFCFCLSYVLRMSAYMYRNKEQRKKRE